MNKSDLIDSVAISAGLSKTDADTAVSAVFDAITKTLQTGTQVSLAGFGNFKLKRRDAYTGRNPRTGTPIAIAASNNVTFKAAKLLKDTLNSL